MANVDDWIDLPVKNEVDDWEDITDSEGSEINPRERSLYNTDLERTAHSFGDDQGKSEYLQKQGYANVHRNPKGSLVGLKDGQYYSDEEGISHPINWLENRAGSALPTAGMIAGSMAGARAGIPGIMAGAGALSGAGEAVRQAIGKKLGTYKGGLENQALDIAGEGVTGGASAGIGEVAAPFINPVMASIAAKGAKLGKKVVSSVGSFNTAVPRGAFEKLIEKPGPVMEAAVNPEFSLNTADSARKELFARDATEDKAIQGARRAFRDKFGNQSVKTQPILDDLDSFIGSNQPTPDGYGALSKDELSQLGKIRQEAFSTLSPVEVGKTGQQTLPLAAPQKTATDLHKFGDYLGRKIKQMDQRRTPGTSDTKFQSYLRGLYGKTKAALHQLDPDGLGAADKQFSTYADKVGLLRRLEKPETGESFVDNFYGRNKEQMRQNARELIPKNIDDIESLAAAKAFQAVGPSGSAKGRRSGFGNAAIGGLGLDGIIHGRPGEVLAGVALKAAVEPGLNMWITGNASKLLEKTYGSNWFKAMYNDPKLIQTISNGQLREQVQKLVNSAKVKDSVKSRQEKLTQ